MDTRWERSPIAGISLEAHEAFRDGGDRRVPVNRKIFMVDRGRRGLLREEAKSLFGGREK
jgi:hypothetical protein